ncbi:MAG: hypothetical protein R3F13_20235 [Prosthecobacter sp.]
MESWLKEELYYHRGKESMMPTSPRWGATSSALTNRKPLCFRTLPPSISEIDGDASLSEEARQRKKSEMQDRLSHQGQRIHQISQLLRAYCLYEKDVEYVVEENKAVIVDAQTAARCMDAAGAMVCIRLSKRRKACRLTPRRRRLPPSRFRNYFRQKLGGMTGTAETDAPLNSMTSTISTFSPFRRTVR